MDRRVDRGNATRQAILSTATDLFAQSGYEGTSIESVLERCAISRGALYHHFSNKEALFAAVLESVEQRVAREIAAAASIATNPLDALRLGCSKWLDLANDDPVVRSVVLIDAPSVVGWAAWRAIDDRNALGLLKAVLGGAADAGRIRAELVDTYAHLLLAALIEMSLLIARNADDEARTNAAHEAIEKLISGLLGFEPRGQWQSSDK